MILRPSFYRSPNIDRRTERRALGLDPDRPTGLVLFGAHGAKVMLEIAGKLDDTQLILVCGHNRALCAALEALPATAPRLVVGFSTEIAHYMQLADFFIGKPGPGSISEAAQQGLPAIVVRNTWTMPQERYNVQWLRERRAGLVIGSYAAIRPAVAEMISRLDEFRTSIAQIRNRAVFEIPDILASILDAPDRPLRWDPTAVPGTASRLPG